MRDFPVNCHIVPFQKFLSEDQFYIKLRRLKLFAQCLSIKFWGNMSEFG